MTLLRIAALVLLLAAPTLAGDSKKVFTLYEIDTKEGTQLLPPSTSFAYNYELRKSVSGKNIGSSTGFCATLPNFKTTIVNSGSSFYCSGTLYLSGGTISYSGVVSSKGFVDTDVTVTGGSGIHAGITGKAVQTKQSNDEFGIYKYTFTVQYR